MNGTIQTKKDRPNYFIVLDYVDQATGKRKRPWITTDIPIKGNNKRQANEKLKEVLAEYEERLKQGIDLGKDVLFTDFLSLWLENKKSSVKESTYDSYKLAVEGQIIPFFEPKKLKINNLQPAHIQQYVNEKTKHSSENTAIKHLVYISSCLDLAVKQNLIPFNLAKRIDKPKKKKFKGGKFYNESQIKDLLAYSKDDTLGLIILFAVYYGLRRSEILGLKWNAIDFENKIITIRHTVVIGDKKIVKSDSTKNDSSYRTLPMPSNIFNALKKEKAVQAKMNLLQPNDYNKEGYVCVKADGNLIQPNYVTQHFQVLLKKYNMPHIRFHDLRHV